MDEKDAGRLASPLTEGLGPTPPYVPVMERGPQDTVATEMHRLLDIVAEQQRTIKALMVGMPDDGTTPVIVRIGRLEAEIEKLRSALRVAEGALTECGPCAHPDCQAVQREWLDESIAGCRRALGA